jgi:hypothetical protein
MTRNLLKEIPIRDVGAFNALSQSLIKMLHTAGRIEESITVALFALHPRISLLFSYNSFSQFPEEEKALALQLALEGCKEAIVHAERLNDSVCLAHYLSLYGQGLLHSWAFKEARHACERALDVVQRLPQGPPQAYEPVM